MKRISLALLVAVAVVCSAFFAPLVPTSLFIRFGSLEIVAGESPGDISEKDAKEILGILREHGHYGLGERKAVPDYISLFAYFLEYKRIGLFPLEQCSAAGFPACNEYRASVRIGMDCGDFCGGGVIFCLKEANGIWKLDECGAWID